MKVAVVAAVVTAATAAVVVVTLAAAMAAAARPVRQGADRQLSAGAPAGPGAAQVQPVVACGATGALRHRPAGPVAQRAAHPAQDR